MKTEELENIADSLNNDLRALRARKLYITATFMPADGKRPDRVVVEGIKNLRSTGKFTYADREVVNDIINRYSVGLNIKILDSDPCMHNAVLSIE